MDDAIDGSVGQKAPLSSVPTQVVLADPEWQSGEVALHVSYILHHAD